MTEPKRRALLVVDDEAELNAALCEALIDEGYEAVGVPGGEQALEALRGRGFDLLLTDLMMPGMDGLDLLRQALATDPALVGLVMTGQGTIPTAVEAMRIGAFDYVLKPFSLKTMCPILERAFLVRRLRLENLQLRRYVERLDYESPRYRLIGDSPAMQRVTRMIEKVAPTDSTVLVRGPSGTGKELVARALHHNSPRKDKPLVTINCAALQETLLESELFGHEKGSFTGATQAKPGLFEVAEGGTLFIDEIGEMALGLQAKLLRVLEDRRYRRVGGTKEMKSDARIIAATNRPLEEEQKAGRFREDLFYRLNVVGIDLPPLKARTEDIPSLVEHLLSTRQQGKVRWQVEARAMRAILDYPWPGNVRELANVLERARILAESSLITLDDLPDSMRGAPAESEEETEDTLNLDALERRAVLAALDRAKGNKVKAAELLGVSRRSMYRLLDRHRLADHKAG